jgi:hypothetical protein
MPNYRKFDYTMKIFLIILTLARSVLDTLIFKNQGMSFKIILIAIDVCLALMVIGMITMLMRGL